MFARVVRFTEVSADHMDRLVARIEESGGPPEGVTTTGLNVMFDADQGTAVVVQLYATAKDMADAEAIFEAMDAADTPGRRASVDRCAIRLEVS